MPKKRTIDFDLKETPSSIQKRNNASSKKIKIKRATEKPFNCRFKGCNHRVRTKDEIIRHNTSKHMRNTSYSCKKCRESFTRDAELNRHLLLQHNVKRKSKNRTGSWTCRFQGCNNKFDTRDLLWSHKKFHGHHIKKK